MTKSEQKKLNTLSNILYKVPHKPDRNFEEKGAPTGTTKQTPMRTGVSRKRRDKHPNWSTKFKEAVPAYPYTVAAEDKGTQSKATS